MENTLEEVLAKVLADIEKNVGWVGETPEMQEVNKFLAKEYIHRGLIQAEHIGALRGINKGCDAMSDALRKANSVFEGDINGN